MDSSAGRRLRQGRARLVPRTYATERAANSTCRIGWQASAAQSVGVRRRRHLRGRPGSPAWLRGSTHGRCGVETKVNGSVEVRTLSKTFFGALAPNASGPNFDKGRGLSHLQPPHRAGSRRDHHRILRVRHQLTPLASVMRSPHARMQGPVRLLVAAGLRFEHRRRQP